MLSGTFVIVMLRVFRLIVLKLNVIMLSVVMLSFVKLIVFTLRAIMLRLLLSTIVFNEPLKLNKQTLNETNFEAIFILVKYNFPSCSNFPA